MVKRVSFRLTDVWFDESPATPETLDIQSLPTLIIFKNGQPVAKKTGAMLKPELISWIKSNI